MAEKPRYKSSLVTVLSLFLTSAVYAQSLQQMRMTPTEVAASSKTLDKNQIGSSQLEGVRTKILFGNPEKAGYYSILLSVPAHTTIQAHSHRDDRVAVVVSGEWHFGYGDGFDAKLLKTLPPGSVYSEPGGQNHFARTDTTAVIVEISGYGPTDTHYFDSANDPNSKGKK
jgi:quercetin dioxygenase-like cupin family protein